MRVAAICRTALRPGDSRIMFETVNSVQLPSEANLSLAHVERAHIERVMARCNGNISQAASILGLHRRSLQRKLARIRLTGGSTETHPAEGGPSAPAS